MVATHMFRTTWAMGQMVAAEGRMTAVGSLWEQICVYMHIKGLGGMLEKHFWQEVAKRHESAALEAVLGSLFGNTVVYMYICIVGSSVGCSWLGGVVVKSHESDDRVLKFKKKKKSIQSV
jgi:hypothetical protein